MKKHQSDRREFLKKAGRTAVTAPAVAVLLSAQAKQASAQVADTISGDPNPKTDPV